MSKITTKQIPLSVPHLGGRELKYVKDCIKSNWVSSAGFFIGKFEDAVSSFVRNKYAIACVNGTAGLHIALKLCGIEANDEVIVPTLTFIATVNIVRYLSAEPIFMDCDNYMNINCDKLQEFCAKACTVTKAGLINKRTKRIIRAVIPVHIFGNPCDMEKIIKIATKYRLKVIEDATESIGSYYTEGIYKNKFTGTIADFGVYSFNGNKIITSGGGGMILTNNSNLAKKAKYLINQAKDDPVRYIHNEIGFNYRLTSLQAALGLAQFEQLEWFIKIKRQNYELYKSLLTNVEGVRFMGFPEGTSPNYWFYSLEVESRKPDVNRDKLIERLKSNGIQSRPIWRLNHLQRPYRKNQSYKIENAPKIWKRVINLPCSVSLKAETIEYIVSVIRG